MAVSGPSFGPAAAPPAVCLDAWGPMCTALEAANGSSDPAAAAAGMLLLLLLAPQAGPAELKGSKPGAAAAGEGATAAGAGAAGRLQKSSRGKGALLVPPAAAADVVVGSGPSRELMSMAALGCEGKGSQQDGNTMKESVR